MQRAPPLPSLDPPIDFRADGPVVGVATAPGVKELLTSGAVTACFYAHRRQDRPCCEGLGVVRYGRPRYAATAIGGAPPLARA